MVEGGYDVNERLRSANETAKRPVTGLVLDLLLVGMLNSFFSPKFELCF